MKKYNKLFAILFAVLGVTTLKAQTDVTSTYLTNADFSSKDGWTQYISGNYRDIGSGNIGGKLASYAASSTDATHLNSEYFFGFQCRWSGNYSSYNQETSQALPSGVYTLSYDVENVNGSTSAVNYNNLFYVKVGDKTFTDTSVEWMKGKSSWTSHSITFVITEATKATVSLGYGTGSNNLVSGNTPVLYVSHLKLIHRELDDISAENPADLTSYIVNNSFETGNLNGWTYKGSSDTGVKPNSNNTYKTTGVDGNYLYNTWWQGTPLTQTVGNIPNGIYELKVLLASDQNAKLFLLANGEHSDVYTITTDNKTFHDVSYEFKVLTGQVTIGVIGGNDAGEYVDGGHWWYKADNFRLTYKGADISLEKEALDAALAKAKAIDQTTIPGIVATSLNSAINIAENVEYALNPIKAATNELLAVLTTVDEVQAPYIETKALITSSNSMLTNSTASDADKATFQNTITKAEEDLNNATDKATIDAIAVTIMNAQKAYCLVAAPTEGHPFDMTHLIVNPHFDQDKTGWTSDGGAQNKAIATNKTNGIIEGKFFENWNGSAFTGSIYQTIEGLPSGTYLLTAAAFGNGAHVFANDVQTQITSDDGAWYEVEVKINDGTLKFGVQNNNNTGWMGIDNVSLQFIAALDLSEFISAYEAALASAVAARDNAEYTHITGIERTNLVNAIDQSIAEETKEAYQEATQSLANATNAFIAAKSDYDILAAEIIIAKGLGMTDERINGITAGKTGAVAYPDLKVDEYNYIINDVYTESATLGSWTEDFGGDLDGEGYKAGGPKYLDDWQGNKTTRTAKQTVTLPAGDYALSVIARGQAGASGNLYYKIGDVTTDVALIMKGNRGRGVDVNGVANFSEEGEYNCNGEGFGWEYRFITFHLDTETQVEIGASVTIQGQWASVYAPVLLTDPSSKKALLLSQIASLLENVPSGIMNKDVEATLNTKKTVAQNASNANTTAELDEIYTEFKNAVDAANTSIADYAAILTYISKANNIDESIAAAYKTHYDNRTLAESAVTVFQALEVATYNYVMANFTYDVEMEAGAWIPEGPVGSLSGQHYDGSGTSSYLEQSSAAWGQNAWSISYKQDKTLPAGDYVFKVAGRRASGTGNTLSLVVTNINDPENPVELGMVNDFPEGDTGLGINKNGITSFDAGDEAGFANNNNGRGWQWRYVKFTLTSETTVQVAVEAEATTTHQWISFCDATLQMTEDTYLDANMGALDAPTAAAEALVDTKPMGTAENNDLKAALALPVTTGAELLAKIEALNIAVANANAWIPKYNEAKAPLVAALERFETDYNDGANGCLYHLQKAAWSTVIEKVQAAAEAKDVTNSYAGFEAATTDLVAALDAAQASINMYAKLKAEIAYAQAYTPLIEGNAAGHTAAITAAQNAYDAAEIADASELILAMQNYKVLDYTYVTDTYSASCNLGNWTGSTGTGKSEHWSGNAETTYFDYSRWSGEAKAYEATQTITLPAGEYVLMAAGRASEVEGTEAYIKVDDNKVSFNTKGSYGLGIDTDGKANFSADGTYGRDGEGYGWEYRFIEFTLTEETEVTLVAGMNIVDSYNPLSWAGVCTPQLFTTPLSGAKNNLQKAIDDAEATLAAYPIGEEAFQISENSDAYKVLGQAIVTAKDYLGESNIGILEEATETLNAAVETFETSYVLNDPEEGEAFNMVLNSNGGWQHDGKAVTYIANDRKDAGNYNIRYLTAPNVNYAQAFTFTPADIPNHYTMSMTDVDGNERYVCTGRPHGGNTSQIRTTTNAEDALVVKVIATKSGVYNLYNTEANNYIGSQDAGFYTVNSHINFNLIAAEKANVTLTISSAGWATLILPFNADIPEGVVAYTSEEVADYGNGDAVQLIEAESFVANTPYLVSGVPDSYVFSGYGLAKQDTCIVGLFTGTYVDYQTTANSNTYVLQKHGDEVAFYLVGDLDGDGNYATPTVKPYRIYMTYEAPAGETAAPMFRIGRGTTGIEDAEWTMDNGQWTIYDLMGRKVTTMEKGNMYIVNGKKVIVK
ncbi:MAG: hypothetical protein E7091_02280 [Bacteroidales bacterium]|nr:hypothetical protein [Bacteroidales bacterium]